MKYILYVICRRLDLAFGLLHAHCVLAPTAKWELFIEKWFRGVKYKSFFVLSSHCNGMTVQRNFNALKMPGSTIYSTSICHECASWHIQWDDKTKKLLYFTP